MNYISLLEINVQEFILPAVLLLLLVGSAVMAFMRRSKYTQAADKLKKDLKPGDKIKTYAGIYGEIIEIKTAKDGSNYAIIKSGEGDKVSYLSVDVEAIYGYDFKDEIDDEVSQAVVVESQPVESEKSESETASATENKEDKEEQPKKTRKTKKAE